MADEVKTTNEPEVKEVQPVVPTDDKKETIGDVLETTPKAPEKPETVPLTAFLELKKESKEVKAALKSLQDSISKGASTEEVTADLQSIADEHDVDPIFLKKLTAAIKAQTEQGFESRIGDKLKSIEAKEQQEKIDKAFNKAYADTIEKYPEYKDIANSEVIKTLSLDPKNAKKTFSELLVETYGRAVPGRHTIETTTPGGGKEPETVDFKRASTDTEYFKTIMSDPKLKKEYNDNIEKRLRL